MNGPALIMGLAVATIVVFLFVFLYSVRQSRRRRHAVHGVAASRQDAAQEAAPPTPAEVNRKYVIILSLTWALVLLFVFNGLREPVRKQERQKEAVMEYVDAGAKIFAEYCVACHGPVGEGHIGPPINNRLRPSFAEGSWDADKRQFVMDDGTYATVRDTIAAGRAGNANPTWVRLPAEPGKPHVFASYTNMPAWSKTHSGPLTEQQVDQVTTFLMFGNAKPDENERTGWQRVSGYIAKPRPPEQGKFPAEVAGLSEAEKALAEDLVQNKFACTACHTFGTVGGFVGPDLTKAGTWGMDAEFLRDWIYDAPSVKNRMPTYFSNYGGPYADPSEQGLKPLMEDLPATAMPSFKEKMTPEERDLLVRYLLGLQ